MRDADTSLPVITPWLPGWELEVGEEAQRVPSSARWGPRDGLGQPQAPTPPHSYRTGAEIETQRRQQEVHSDPAGLLPGVCLLAWMPESPSLVAILAPPSTCRGACFLGWKMEKITAPCPLHGGGHTWGTQVAEGPVPQELLLRYRGPLRAITASCPDSLQIPKPSPRHAHCPEKQASMPRPHSKAPARWDLNWGPLQLSLPPC